MGGAKTSYRRKDGGEGGDEKGISSSFNSGGQETVAVTPRHKLSLSALPTQAGAPLGLKA